MSQRFDYVPACSPGNKPCGRSCIPETRNCLRHQRDKLGKSALYASSGSFAAYIGAKALGNSAEAAAARNPNRRVNLGAGWRDFNTTFSPGSPGYKRAVASNTLSRTSDVLSAISLAQSLRSAHKQYQLTKRRSESRDNQKKRKDHNFRSDFKQLKCGPTTRQCGNRCLPLSQNCGIHSGRKVARTGLGIEAAGTALGIAGANTYNKKLEAVGAGLRVVGNVAQATGSQKIASEYFKQGDYGKAALYQGLAGGSLVKTGIGAVSTTARVQNLQKHSNQKRTVAPL